jgi:hypothetical protein
MGPGCVKTRSRTKREERCSSDGQSQPRAQRPAGEITFCVVDDDSSFHTAWVDNG